MICGAFFGGGHCDLPYEHRPEWHRAQLPSGLIVRWICLVTTETEYQGARAKHEAAHLPL